MSLLRTALVSSNARVVFASSSTSLRSFHASPLAAKSATEKVKEVADNVRRPTYRPVEWNPDVLSQVNKSVGRGLASAIEKGEEVSEATKETVGTSHQASRSRSPSDIMCTGATTEKVKQSADVAGQKANQTAAGLKEGKEDFKKDVRKEVRK